VAQGEARVVHCHVCVCVCVCVCVYVLIVNVSPVQWPERIIHCHSCVISLDFSANNASQLAVGMDDGTMAIYDISQSSSTCIADSR